MSPSTKALFLIFFSAAVLANSHSYITLAAPVDIPAFSIEGGTTDERVFLKDVLGGIFLKLPASQQDLLRNGLVINISEKPGAFAFTAEDDPAYRFPDRNLYPKGTIKVNVTRLFIDYVRNEMMRDFTLVAFAHEIKHIQQYMENPVRSLFHAQDCPNGICDENLLKGTEQKYHYEVEAVAFGCALISAEKRPFTYEVEAVAFGCALISAEKRPFTWTCAGWFAEEKYSHLHRPALLARACAENGLLTDEEQKEVKRQEGIVQDRGLLALRPYLVPVFKRLRSCM